jgi:3-oxoacyl-(acyl-carrier-protein) synthase
VTALERCLRRGGLEASAIDALFAPAQAVPAFDRATAAALGHVFRATGASPAITATRAVLGHTHAASTAIDAVAAVTALADGRVPPTLNLRCPVADLPFVRGEARAVDVRTALVAGYGFGGHAAALALRRYTA